MKRKYIKPFTERVILNVSSDILEVPIGGPSKGARSEDAWARRNPFMNDDEDDGTEDDSDYFKNNPRWNSWED